jgi:cyclic pyranopterin monophosphate synthase
MVDVGSKEDTERRAVAEGFVHMAQATLVALSSNTLAKGDALATARVAGILAAKKTADWIPLCHPLRLTHAQVDLELEPARRRVRIRAEVRTVGPTGVEMEALTAVTGAALALYDMSKAIDKNMTIDGIVLLEKEGGRSGRFVRGDSPRSAPRRKTSKRNRKGARG